MLGLQQLGQQAVEMREPNVIRDQEEGKFGADGVAISPVPQYPSSVQHSAGSSPFPGQYQPPSQ
jgi:hypothetical protein